MYSGICTGICTGIYSEKSLSALYLGVWFLSIPNHGIFQWWVVRGKCSPDSHGHVEASPGFFFSEIGKRGKERKPGHGGHGMTSAQPDVWSFLVLEWALTESFWHVKNANQVEPRLAPLSAFAVFLEHSYRIITNSNGLSSFVKMRFGKQHPNNSV